MRPYTKTKNMKKGRVKIKKCYCGYRDVLIIEDKTFAYRCPCCGHTDAIVPKYELELLDLQQQLLIQNINHRKQTSDFITKMYA